MVKLSNRRGTPKPLAVRRVERVILAVILLSVLALVPVLFVQDWVAYVAAWSTFLVVSLTSLLSGRAMLLGRITRTAARVLVYVVGVLAAVILGIALRLASK